MKYQAPYGSSDPDAPYVDRNTPGAIAGSKVPAAAIEDPQREIVAFLAASGVTADEADRTQLTQAARRQSVNYRAVGGTANALTVTLSPAVTTHVPGMPLRLKIATANTGAVTLNAGSGAVPVQTMLGQPLQAGDLPAGAIMVLVDDVTSWKLVSIAYSETPRLTLADPVIWVRTDGSDSNTGAGNSAITAKATIAGAVAELRKYFLSGGVGIIRLGNAGTYGPPGSIPNLGGIIRILGDVGNAANYIISSASTGSVTVGASNGNLEIQGCRIQTNNVNIASVGGAGLTSITLATVILEILTASAIALMSNYGAIVTLLDGVEFRGNGASAMQARGGLINWSGTVNFAAPTYSVASVHALWGGQVTVTAAGARSGNSTGDRYLVGAGAIAVAGGGGATFFPGTTAGVVDPGGIYVN